MKTISHLLLLAGLFGQEARAVPVPEDFARGLIVDADSDSAIYEISVPESVYLTATRSDLGDIRVFNGADQVVPHAIRPAPAEPPVIEWVDVPFYPELPGSSASTQFGPVGAGDDDVVTVLNERDGAVFVESADVGAYIVDLDATGGMAEALTIELTRAPQVYVKKVRLEHSADLNEWDMLVPAATLLRLQRGQNTLDQNRIDLPSRARRYLRISWIDHDGTTQIAKVLAAVSPRIAIRKEWRALTRVAGKDEPGTMRFDTGGQVPVDTLQLLFPEPNFALEVRVESRARETDAWRTRHTGMHYQLRVQDQLVETGPVSIPASTDRYWRLHYGTEDDPGLRDARLNVGWRAGKLLFLARGEGPFTVAFGSANIEPQTRPAKVLLDALERGGEDTIVVSAKVREEKVLAGGDALEKRIRVDLRKVVLWSILIAGVLLLAYMAVRLGRQMREAAGPPS